MAPGTVVASFEKEGFQMARAGAWETVKLQGEQLVDEVRRLIHEGNVRRVVVKQKGTVVAEFPLTVGVVASVAAPVLAAIGALVALLTDCSIDLERRTGTARKKAARKKTARRSAGRAKKKATSSRAKKSS
jgi:hypothetical protein